MATRFHLPNANTPPVSPAFQSYTHGASTTRRNLVVAGSGTALSNVSQTPDGADHLVAGDTFHVQFVSAPLAAQTFTSGDAFKYTVQAFEANAANNLFVQVWMGIYTNDGATLKATLRSKTADGLELNTGAQSRTQASTLSSTYTCLANERLAVEFSVTGTPTAAGGTQGHNASFRWGDNGAGGDLAEDDTQAGSTLNGWLEFTNTVLFPLTATRGRVSWAELETPLVPTRGRASWAEFETPVVATRGRASWAEFETPVVATRGRLSWSEFEAPAVATRGRASWAEFEVPTAGGGDPTSNDSYEVNRAWQEAHGRCTWWFGQDNDEFYRTEPSVPGPWTYRRVGSWLSLERKKTRKTKLE